MLLSVQYSSNSASDYTGAQQQLHFFVSRSLKESWITGQHAVSATWRTIPGASFGFCH